MFSDLRRECKARIFFCYFFIANLQTNIKTNIKLFWAFTKSKKKTKSYPTQFKYGGETSSNSKDICEMFAIFFKSTYPNRSSDRTINTAQTVNPTTANPIFITLGSVENIIHKIDLNENGGPDEIPNFFLKMTSKQISVPLSKLFDKSIRLGEYPKEFKTSFLTPIFKKRDESQITNYRPVCQIPYRSSLKKL